MIELKNIRKSYKTRHETLEVLKGISLTVPEHSLVMLLGESGSGKSTLCNLLGLLDTATSGEYYLNGIPVHTLSSAERTKLRREQVSFVFQNYNLIPTMTAFENIELPLGYRNVAKKERLAIVENALHSVGLSERAGHRPAELSGGEQQRVAIARALVMNPSLLIADEPTGNLDRTTTKEIMKTLTEAGRKKTIFMVTHNEELTSYADIVIRLKRGEIEL
ncbi:MAG: ABC transporter ATP-binding protein [Clostridia bacterium]|nr:ABC transporter ATP-binding protein [Clostridia bacterium]